MTLEERRLELIQQIAEIESEREVISMIVNWEHLRKSLFDGLEVYGNDPNHCFEVEAESDREQIIAIIDSRVKKMCLEFGLDLPKWAKE